jgi:CBS domain-containing protein
MTVQQAMTTSISTARPSSTITEVAEMMRRDDCGFIPVLKDDRLVGVITDRGLVIRYLAGDGAHANMLTEQIGNIMMSAPVSVQAGESIENAGRLMAEHQVRRLPLMDNGRLVGV